jgi:hypothetical protein
MSENHMSENHMSEYIFLKINFEKMLFCFLINLIKIL